jgi:hypothetical protein
MKLGDIARLIDVTPRPCWRKQRWKSQGAAEAHLRALVKMPFAKDVDRLSTYECKACNSWHVGRRSVVR